MIENNEYDVPPNSISPERAPRVSDSEQRAVVDHIRKNNELTECLKNKTSLADTHGKSTHITETERKFAQVIVTSADTSFLYGMFFMRCLTNWYRKNSNPLDCSTKISKSMLLGSTFSYVGRYLLLACFLFVLMTETIINLPLFIVFFGFSFWGRILTRKHL